MKGNSIQCTCSPLIPILDRRIYSARIFTSNFIVLIPPILMTKLFSIGLLALAFASCQNSDTAETATSDSSSTSTVTTLAAPAADPGAQQILTSSPATPTTVTTVNPDATGANPEHGKPGHRCDIAVGAPLNSPAGNPAAPAISSTPAAPSAPVAAPSPATGSNTKLNPAHGEPGHDCAVAVGAPLKS